MPVGASHSKGREITVLELDELAALVAAAKHRLEGQGIAVLELDELAALVAAAKHRLPDGRITVADALYADPDISVYLDGREYHSQSVERIRADLHRRNQLEQQGRLVLEFTYGDVVRQFDDVVALMREALEGGVKRTPAEVPRDGLAVTGSDVDARRLEVAVDAAAWVKDEAERQRHLAAANAARLKGWRLHRQVVDRNSLIRVRSRLLLTELGLTATKLELLPESRPTVRATSASPCDAGPRRR